MRRVILPIIGLFLVISTEVRAENPIAFTVQVSASGSSCSEAVSNAAGMITTGSPSYTADQATATEFGNMLQASAFCVTSGFPTPTTPATGSWKPVGTYIPPGPSDDQECSTDGTLFYTQQKLYGACAQPSS